MDCFTTNRKKNKSYIHTYRSLIFCSESGSGRKRRVIKLFIEQSSENVQKPENILKFRVVFKTIHSSEQYYKKTTKVQVINVHRSCEQNFFFQLKNPCKITL